MAVIRQSALDEQREKLANKNADVVHPNADDIANDGIRLERDDKKTEKKTNEKEKYLSKPLLKEKKPTKFIISDDPVQEYVIDDQNRGGRADDSQTESTLVEVSWLEILTFNWMSSANYFIWSNQKAGEEEPAVISLVPDNYPVVLPNGESTLSDKIQPEDAKVKIESSPQNCCSSNL